MSYPPKTAVLTSAVLFTACCTRTAISVLIFFTFFRCLTAVCLLFSIKSINNNFYTQKTFTSPGLSSIHRSSLVTINNIKGPMPLP